MASLRPRPSAAAALLLVALAAPACAPPDAGPSERDRARAAALYEEALTAADLGRNLEAVGMLDAALESDPDLEAAHRARVLFAERAAHFREVVASSEWLVAAYPDAPENGDHLARIVRAHLGDGRVHEAREALGRLDQLEPGAARTELLWARYFLEIGEFPRAKRSAKRSVKIAPRQTTGHHIVGLVLESEGAYDQAILCFRAVLEIDPGHLGARDHLATLLLRTDRGKEAGKHREIHGLIARATPGAFRRFPPEGRIVSFSEIVERIPEWQLGHVELARALMQADRLDEAYERMKLALALDPRSPEANELMATLLRRRGDEEGAAAHARLSDVPGSLQDGIALDQSKGLPAGLTDDEPEAEE